MAPVVGIGPTSMQINSLPYKFRHMSTAEQIERITNLRAKDLMLIDYKSHPAIKGKMAI